MCFECLNNRSAFQTPLYFGHVVSIYSNKSTLCLSWMSNFQKAVHLFLRMLLYNFVGRRSCHIRQKENLHLRLWLLKTHIRFIAPGEFVEIQKTLYFPSQRRKGCRICYQSLLKSFSIGSMTLLLTCFSL